MTLPIIMQGDDIFSRKEVAAQKNEMTSFLENQGVAQDEIIGVYPERNLKSLALIMACIDRGQKVAFCSTREPFSFLQTWLRSLCVHKLIKADEELIYLSDSKKPSMLADRSCFISILRTSGTTAEPKNAVILEKAHKASAASVNDYFSFDQKSVWALSLPLFHVSGLSIIFRAECADGGIFIAHEHADLVLGLKKRLITHLSLVPFQLRRLLDESVDLSFLTAVIMGGDALPVALKQRALALGITLYETYGLTETASMVLIRHCQTGGITILPHVTWRTSADDEILVAGRSLFAGYLSAQGDLFCPMEDGFFATGDRAGKKNEGPLIMGRKNNRIISGGENIQAEQIEYWLDAHPEVFTSVVVGVDDEIYGQVPHAYIKWTNKPLEPIVIRSYLLQHLPPFKIPKLMPWPKNAPDGMKKPRSWFLAKRSAGE